jgi:hypothetical protein
MTRANSIGALQLHEIPKAVTENASLDFMRHNGGVAKGIGVLIVLSLAKSHNSLN